MDSIESYKLITPPNRIQGPKKLCYESQDNVRLSCLNLLFFHTVWNFQIHPRFVKTDLPMDYPQLMMLETPWFWVNYNNSLNWIKAILGWFLLLTMIIVRSQWGRYNLLRFMGFINQQTSLRGTTLQNFAQPSSFLPLLRGAASMPQICMVLKGVRYNSRGYDITTVTWL